MSFAIPFAIEPSQRAVAGAITSASAASATTMWPIRWSGRSPRTSVSTAWRESAANVSGPTNWVAAGVSMTTTSAPSVRRRRRQLDGLVGGDRPADAEADQPALEAAGHREPSTGSPPGDLGVQDREALEREVRVDDLDALHVAGPRLDRQAARQDPADALEARAGLLGELAADPRQEPGHGRLVAEDRAALHRAHGVAPDRPVGGAQLDPRQPGGVGGECLEAQLHARGDRAAQERAVRAHAVVGRGRAHVHDDRRGAVEPLGGQGVDDPVRAHLARPVHADRDGDRARGRHEDRDSPPEREGLHEGGLRRHHGNEHRPARAVEAAAVEREEAVQQQLELVHGGGAVRPGPAGPHDRAAVHEAERDVRVADVDREQHAWIIRVPRSAAGSARDGSGPARSGTIPRAALC